VNVAVRGLNDFEQHGDAGSDGWALALTSGSKVRLACGWAHTVAYTDRVAYAWGSNKHGQCGIREHSVVRKATKITFPDSFRIDRIACGATHCLALLRDERSHGHVYVWGSHGDGKLGLDGNEDVFVPTRLSFGEQSVRDVVCGSDHSFVITEANKVFVWGFLQHAVAFGGDRCTQTTPRYVPQLDGVHQIAAGLDMSFAMFR